MSSQDPPTHRNLSQMNPVHNPIWTYFTIVIPGRRLPRHISTDNSFVVLVTMPAACLSHPIVADLPVCRPSVL
jgi:hypothetical protein